MKNSVNFVEQYPELFEAVAQSQNPKDYLQNLPESYERNLLLHLIAPYSDEYIEVFETKFKIPLSDIK